MMKVNIPTHRYLRKFFLHRYDSRTGQIELSNRRSSGIILLKILQKRNHKFDPKKEFDYETSITLCLSDYYASRAGLFLPYENIHLFNAYMKKEFENSLYDHLLMTLLRDKNANIDEEILSFLNFYGITEDEMKLSSLIKDFYRWRKRRKCLIIK